MSVLKYTFFVFLESCFLYLSLHLLCLSVPLSRCLSISLSSTSFNTVRTCTKRVLFIWYTHLLLVYWFSLHWVSLMKKSYFRKISQIAVAAYLHWTQPHTYNWKLCIVIVTDGDPGFISPFLFASMQTNKAPIHTRRKQYITYYTYVGLCYRKKITRYFFEKIRFIFLLATLITKSTVFWFDFFSPI